MYVKGEQMNFNAQRPNVMKIANVSGPETMERFGVGILRKCDFDVYSKDKHIDIKVERKGAHPKFWIYPDKDTSLLCKLNNQPFSVVGELIMTKVLDSTSIPHAKYLPALVVLPDDEVAYATLSPDVIKGRTKKVGSGEVEEISGRSLASEFINKVYDTQHGKQIKYEHTVDFYTNIFALNDNLNWRDLRTLRNDMLKQALLQGLFIMNDMHEENVGFLINKDTKKVSLMPIYDYGSALQLDWNFKVTYNKSQNFQCSSVRGTQAELLQRQANNLASNTKNNVMFGIHTPLIEASTNIRTTENDRRDTFIKDSLRTLMQELAQEMKDNKELLEFYQNVKQQVNFYAIREFYAHSIDPTTGDSIVPDAYISVAEQTFKASCFMLDKELANAKNNTTAKDTHSSVSTKTR